MQLLKEWTEAFPYDFQDEKAMAELKAIAHRVTLCDEVRPGGLGVLGGVDWGISNRNILIYGPFPCDLQEGSTHRQ